MKTMTRPRVKLRVTDGQWEAAAEEEYGSENGSATAQAVRWTGTVPVFDPAQRTAWLADLKAEPWDIYRFMQGEACPSLDEVVQAAADAATSSLEDGVGAADEAKKALQAGLESDPLLGLELIEMTREALLEFVFSAW